MRRRTTLGLLTVALAGCTNPTETTTETRTMTDGGTTGTSVGLTAPAFDDGDPIPTEFTCDGADRSPELLIEGAPDATEAFALLVDDPDAPSAEPFVHWMLFDLPGDTRRVPPDVPATERVDALGGAGQGTNGFGSLGYRGPCPPRGDGPHTYRFRLFALETETETGLDPGANREALLDAVESHTLARATVTGTDER